MRLGGRKANNDTRKQQQKTDSKLQQAADGDTIPQTFLVNDILIHTNDFAFGLNLTDTSENELYFQQKQQQQLYSQRSF